MKPDRIIAYGCSVTHGMGLPDQPDDPEETKMSPSIHAWPALVGEYLGVPVENRGIPGASNKYIAHRMVQEVDAILPNTLVLVMWSFYHRYTTLTSPEISPEPNTIAWWNNDLPRSKMYLENFSHDYDGEHSDLMIIQAVNSVYELNEVKVVNLSVQQPTNFPHTWFSYPPEFVFSEEHCYEKTWLRHPGVKANKVFARRLSVGLMEKLGENTDSRYNHET